jgi:hypothetical protein
VNETVVPDTSNYILKRQEDASPADISRAYLTVIATSLTRLAKANLYLIAVQNDTSLTRLLIHMTFNRTYIKFI